MSENVLEKIIKKKIERVDLLKKSISLNSLIEKIDKNHQKIIAMVHTRSKSLLRSQI